MWKSVVFVAALAGGPAMAQDLVFETAPTEACLARTGVDPRSCIGLAATACTEATPGGYTTVVTGGCADRELSYWDRRLNLAYQALRPRLADMDAANAMPGRDLPSAEIALRDMQRAWISYRDARCSYVAAQYGGGTGASPAFLFCMMHETAEQALDLEADLAR
ncbi:MAG: lysozyme inhibitor LprI family protein [Celeribacter sp.]|jgi:uncharacterized protein YecT (DUF1311 family)